MERIDGKSITKTVETGQPSQSTIERLVLKLCTQCHQGTEINPRSSFFGAKPKCPFWEQQTWRQNLTTIYENLQIRLAVLQGTIDRNSLPHNLTITCLEYQEISTKELIRRLNQ